MDLSALHWSPHLSHKTPRCGNTIWRSASAGSWIDSGTVSACAERASRNKRTHALSLSHAHRVVAMVTSISIGGHYSEAELLRTCAGTKMSRSRPRYYTPKEVAAHNAPGDCWVSYLGKVYNLTSLCKEHTGEQRNRLNATCRFRKI